MQRSAAAAACTSSPKAFLPSASPTLISQAGRLSSAMAGITGVDSPGRVILLPSSKTRLGSAKEMARTIFGARPWQPEARHCCEPSGRAQISFSAESEALVDSIHDWFGRITAR